MLDSGASHNLMARDFMEKLGLDTTKYATKIYVLLWSKYEQRVW